MDTQIFSLKKLIDASQHIVFFGGAGVSTESGIPDFRSAQGLFHKKIGKLSPETILRATFFHQHPDLFYIS